MTVKFFILPLISAEKAFYQFGMLALAEGFQELGIPFHGSDNYWFNTDTSEYTIKQSDADADVHIYDAIYFNQGL